MSLDYPNRADWMAVRSTPSKFPVKVLHLSEKYTEQEDPRVPGAVVVLRQGLTYSRQQAAVKAGLHAVRRARRAYMRARKAAGNPYTGAEGPLVTRAE